MSLLGEYLLEQGKRPWGWSDRDCCTFPADWCIRAGYPDPMAWIRGTFSTDEEVLALMKDPGLLKLATKGFGSIGLQRTKRPRPGDVAVVARTTADGTGMACAIRSDERWITLMHQGLEAGEARALRIWRVEWARL